MGSIAQKFVSRSLMLALFLFMGSLALPVSPGAQNYFHAAILEHNVNEANRVLQQRQREATEAQEQVKRQRRLDGEFATLMVKAKAQHAMIAQWYKARSKKLKAKDGVHKKRLQ
jgi:hypothetical protein